MQPALPWFLKATSSWRGFTPAKTALFGLPFLAMGVVCLWYLTLRPTLDWMRSRDWQATDAKVEKAWLATVSRRSQTKQIGVQFRYQYHGVEHVGTRYSFVSAATTVGVNRMMQVVESLPPGTKVICWVNPEDPGEAVLDRAPSALALVGLFIAMTFITVGITCLGFLGLPLFRRRFCAKRFAKLDGLVTAGVLPEWVLRPFTARSNLEENDVALVIAEDVRLSQVLRLIFFNLVCTGIVGAFVCMDVGLIVSGSRGKALFLSLLLVPFVLACVRLFWMLVKSCRSLWRPRWVAAIRPTPDFNGGEAAFCWAWLDSRHGASLPEAMVRIVAQAAHWDKATDRPRRDQGYARGTKSSATASWGRNHRELAAVEASITGASEEILLTLPQVTPPREPAKRSRWLPPVTGWGGWWHLEVACRNGEMEMTELTQAEKLII